MTHDAPVRVWGLLNVTLLALVALALVGPYYFGTLSYFESGSWPSYARPESWSSPLAARYPVLFGMLMHYSVWHFFFGWVFMLSGIFRLVVVLVSRDNKLRMKMTTDIALIALTMFFYIDPLGLLNWFMD